MNITEIHHAKVFSHLFTESFCARVIITDHYPITVIVRAMMLLVILFYSYFSFVREVIYHYLN